MNQLSGFCNLKVNGHLAGFRFGQNAFFLFCKMHGVELTQIDKAMAKPEGMRDIVYCANKAYCLSNSQDPDFDNEMQCGDWLDDQEPETMQVLTETMLNARIAGIKLSDVVASKKKEKKP